MPVLVEHAERRVKVAVSFDRAGYISSGDVELTRGGHDMAHGGGRSHLDGGDWAPTSGDGPFVSPERHRDVVVDELSEDVRESDSHWRHDQSSPSVLRLGDLMSCCQHGPSWLSAKRATERSPG